MERVFFDSNTAGEGGYWLCLPLSLADLDQIADKHDGMRVLLCMPKELELQAELFYDAARELWVGRPIEGAVRLLDNSP